MTSSNGNWPAELATPFLSASSIRAEAPKIIEFEKDALLRDRVVELRRELVGDEEGLEAIAALRRGGYGPMPRSRQGRARPRRR